MSPQPSGRRIPPQDVPSKKVSILSSPFDTDTPKFILENERWMDGAKVRGGVTTYLKDSEQYASKLIILMTSLLPMLLNNFKEIVQSNSGRFQHCHPLRGNALDRSMDVIREIYGPRLAEESEYLRNIWQIGFTQGVRLICGISDSNQIYPLFIDYHHLVSPNKYFNQRDVEKYRYCPRKDYLPEGNNLEVAVTTHDDLNEIRIDQNEFFKVLDKMCDSCTTHLETLI